MPADRDWTVVVPVKGLATAKSRLGFAHASELMGAFVADALAAVAATPEVAEVIVATGDPDVRALATDAGARVVDDDGHPGINAAAAHGASRRRSQGGLVVMVADLPALTPRALSLALLLAGGHRTCVLADADGDGTTMWFAHPSAPVLTAFGPGSRAAHVTAGAVDLVAAHPDDADALWPARCDVDTPAALERAAASGVGPATRALLGSLPH